LKEEIGEKRERNGEKVKKMGREMQRKKQTSIE